MAKILRVDNFVDGPGDLAVFNEIVPGSIKRLFYIYGAGGQRRGGHRHYTCWNVLICLQGTCRVYCNDGSTMQYFLLGDPRQCLVIEPKDWHIMDCFSEDAILLVLSNQYYQAQDYIYEPYPSDGDVVGNELIPTFNRS